jgi:DNA topoisomerase-1
MTRLMNSAYFRVGDERYSRKNKTYGIATLRRKHLRAEGDTMIFEYTGKWGQVQRKVVTDARLRRIVDECVALPGYEIFKYNDEGGGIRDVKARDLNAYVKAVMGPEFTPKNFRTWPGTLFAAVKLAEIGAMEDLKQAEKNVLEAVDDVAGRLGNTRDIARASYVSPRIIDHYMEGSVVAYYGERLEEVIAAEQGEPYRGGSGAPGTVEQEAPPRVAQGGLKAGLRPGGQTVNKTQIALKLLKSKRARQIAMKALKNEQVRKVVAKQVSRRLTGK